MRRRKLLQAGVVSAGAATAGAAFPAPAISQGRRELRLVTTWPSDFPGLGKGAVRFANRVTEGTGQQITVRVYSAGELVPAFESFDAVARGDVDMYHASEAYWQNKTPVFNFFAAMPLGMIGSEMDAWIHHGGGQAMWDELTGQYGVKSLACGNTGVQMAGWFQDEINSLEDMTRLTFRIAGLGAEVFRQVGIEALTVPGGEILEAMKTRRIDACEFMGPWTDLALGLQTVARYYYYPGMHQPGETISLGINAGLWNGLTSDQRSIVAMAAQAENNALFSEFNSRNGEALDELISKHGVEVRRLDRVTFRSLALAARDVVTTVGEENAFSRRVYNSFIEFRRKVSRWTELSDQAYVEARARYI